MPIERPPTGQNKMIAKRHRIEDGLDTMEANEPFRPPFDSRVEAPSENCRTPRPFDLPAVCRASIDIVLRGELVVRESRLRVGVLVPAADAVLGIPDCGRPHYGCSLVHL